MNKEGTTKMNTTVTATFTTDNTTKVMTFTYKDLATCFAEVENTAKALRNNYTVVSYKLTK